LLQVIKAAFQETCAEHFHFSPYREYWKPSPEKRPECIFSELYTLDAFLDEYTRMTSQPAEPGCTLEWILGGIMLWSDLMHLTSFGNASLWPIYLFIGNLSKYTRTKPTSFSAHHLAYLPKVRNSMCMLIPAYNHFYSFPTQQDFYHSVYGRVATSEVLTHCKQELMHAIWILLLDTEFMAAYIHRIILECSDQIS